MWKRPAEVHKPSFGIQSILLTRVCVFTGPLEHYGSLLSPTVSAETLQKNLELMGRQIKNLEKDLETFPPPQNNKDLFVEKMSISSFISPIYFTRAQIKDGLQYFPTVIK